MYSGSNPKALLSIKLITEGFVKELQRKPYDQINIRDLCRTADVSRQTFYNLFQNKEDPLDLFVTPECTAVHPAVCPNLL